MCYHRPMTAERRPDHQPPAPRSPEEDPEQTLNAVLWGLVNGLFTRQNVAEALQGATDEEETAAFVLQWKQYLVQHLELTTSVVIDKFLADFEQFQAQQAALPSPISGPTGEANSQTEPGPTP